MLLLVGDEDFYDMQGADKGTLCKTPAPNLTKLVQLERSKNLASKGCANGWRAVGDAVGSCAVLRLGMKIVLEFWSWSG